MKAIITITPLPQDASLFIIGPDASDIIHLVQDIYKADKYLSALILTLPHSLAAIRQSLNYAPAIGNGVLCIAWSALTFKVTVTQAILRTRQKRSFHKISLSSGLESIIDTSPAIPIEHLGNFLDQAPVGAILLQPESGDIRALNRKCRQLLGKTLPNRTIKLADLFTDEQVSMINKMIDSGMSEGVSLELDKYYIEMTQAKVTNEQGDPFIILFLTDITAANKEDQRIRSVLEAMPQMAWTADITGTITYFNTGWFNYTGQSAVEALSGRWQDIVKTEELPLLLAKWQDAIYEGKIFQHAVRLKAHNGEFRWHLARGVPVFDDDRRLKFWTGTFTDVHDQVKRTEELEQKVKDRTRSLQESNTELEQYARVTSHDLREPLRKISVFTDMLKTRSYEALGEGSRQYVDKIATTASRMTQTLSDILSYTQLGKEESRQQVDLNEILKAVIDDLELFIEQKSANIYSEKLPTIIAVPVQMRQIFYNMLNNALKFSHADIPPVINIAYKDWNPENNAAHPELRKEYKYTDIAISDNGIGFDQKYAEQIFEIFKRLHTRESYPGSGIGLALCQKIMETHDGTLFAQSIAGEGSTFHLIFSNHTQQI